MSQFIRCLESTGLEDNKRNKKIVQDKNKAIDYELKHGRFDYLHFFPHGARAKYFRAPSKDMLFSEWWDEWIAEKSLKPTTERGWNSSYRCHIGTHFGHLLLSQINEHELLVFRRMLEGKGLKASSINDKIWKPLCMSLYTAYNRGIIDKYPCEGIRRLPEEPVDIDPFTYEELQHLLNVIKVKKPEFYDMIFIWSRIGVRPGELYALKWKSIDYFNKKLMIRETRHSNGSEDTPKTVHSIRDIDLRPSVIDAFKRQEARTGLSDGHIFLTHAGKPFSKAFMRKKFRYLLKLAGLRYRPPAHMRHTFATLHIAAKENISWVSKTLGHSSVEITLKRYNRFVPNLTREDGSAFETIMEEKAKSGNDPSSLLSKIRNQN